MNKRIKKKKRNQLISELQQILLQPESNMIGNCSQYYDFSNLMGPEYADNNSEFEIVNNLYDVFEVPPYRQAVILKGYWDACLIMMVAQSVVQWMMQKYEL